MSVPAKNWQRRGPISVAPRWVRRAWWCSLYRLRFLVGTHRAKRPLCWIFGHDPYGFRMTPKHRCLVCGKVAPSEVTDLGN